MFIKGLAHQGLLNSYNIERLPVVKDMLMRTTDLFKETMAKTADTSPVVQSGLFRQLGVNYRWSPIVVDEQPGDTSSDQELAAYLPEDKSVLRAGDRASDAPQLVPYGAAVTAPTSLFEFFKPTRHAILLFNPSAEQVHDVVTSLRLKLPLLFNLAT